MTLDPDQLLLTGQRLADAHATDKARREGESRASVDARHRLWATVLDARPLTVAELAAAWWPDIGEPRAWRMGDYPWRHIRRARQRVAVLVRCGLAVIGAGCLPHRKQEGIVVVRARAKKGDA